MKNHIRFFYHTPRLPSADFFVKETAWELLDAREQSSGLAHDLSGSALLRVPGEWL
jgi:hypothetical protein